MIYTLKWMFKWNVIGNYSWKKIPNLFEKFICRRMRCELKLKGKNLMVSYSPFYFDKVFLSPWKSLFKFSVKKNDLWHISLLTNMENNFQLWKHWNRKSTLTYEENRTYNYLLSNISKQWSKQTSFI